MLIILLAASVKNTQSSFSIIDFLNSPIISGVIGAISGSIISIVSGNIYFKNQIKVARLHENRDDVIKNICAKISEIKSYLSRFDKLCEIKAEEDVTVARLIYEFKQYYIANRIYLSDSTIEKLINDIFKESFNALFLYRAVYIDYKEWPDHPAYHKQREDLRRRASEVLIIIFSYEEELMKTFRDILGVKKDNKKKSNKKEALHG